MVTTMMFRALCFSLVLGLPLAAQTAETAFFRAVLLPSNEVPPVSGGNRGVADLFASAVRDASGQIVSGTLDFLVRPTFTATATVTVKVGRTRKSSVPETICPEASRTAEAKRSATPRFPPLTGG